MKRIRITALIVLTGLLLSGCGQAGTGEPTDEPGGPVPSSTSQPGSTNPSTDPTMPPTGPGASPPAGQLTLTGVITAGVEPGCLLLDNYLLVGGPKEILQAGARVTVTGRADPGLMSTCQQGTPLLVESAKRA